MTGLTGTFVVAWTHTETDGLRGAPPAALEIGAEWRWRGEALRIDGPADVLRLPRPESERARRARAARAVHRLLSLAGGGQGAPELPAPDPADTPFAETDTSFTVTDGRMAFVVTVIEAPEHGTRLAMFSGPVPPRDRALWVVERAAGLDLPARPGPTPGVICFARGTLIDTPRGRRPVETLAPGDLVETCDDGPQPVLWRGSRRLSGARLRALPHLRPVRLRAAALDPARPDADLIVSPRHRIVLRGKAARALFNAPEVLVAAADLVNDRTIQVFHGLREVDYVHLMFARHQILRANGIESESFHPDATALEMIAPQDRSALVATLRDQDPGGRGYGPTARRALTRSEAAILRHDMAA
ncbi:Hint domain-containing protein [Phaeovulum vinaykumarii]|uniref:Hint domain-containing protein n=1 Tax=Phaeovulum vinaykumarii TaxID=407234 RepID=A0A1N7LLG2_9RHOB|nr:Hint domain-containing protein [Phaeovulum vinaykumarii]SIS74634.1 Hint domain-containing protein [Phaeovulum vinaykumarii]SOC05159.1 Hint domain-containing protein [Phaeovulum vinaykumarii]